MIQQADFDSVKAWRDAGSPLDKSFIVRRVFSTLAHESDWFIQQWYIESANSGCVLIARVAELCLEENSKAESFSIVTYGYPAPDEIWEYNNRAFNIALSKTFDDRLNVEVSAAIVLHSREGGA